MHGEVYVANSLSDKQKVSEMVHKQLKQLYASAVNENGELHSTLDRQLRAADERKRLWRVRGCVPFRMGDHVGEYQLERPVRCAEDVCSCGPQS